MTEYTVPSLHLLLIILSKWLKIVNAILEKCMSHHKYVHACVCAHMPVYSCVPHCSNLIRERIRDRIISKKRHPRITKHNFWLHIGPKSNPISEVVVQTLPEQTLGVMPTVLYCRPFP